ncbi:MAG: hypothetical protein IJ292_03225 [Clostridia bacterium]|nr:hypothetical protein [Clostridia bacterium]
MIEYVKFYSVNDLASTDNLKMAVSVIESFDCNAEYTNVNNIVELYNIKQYFDNNVYLLSWDELTKTRYIRIVGQFNKVIGVFFSKIKGDNFLDYYNELDNQYNNDFWKLVEYYGVYKRLSSIEFSKIIKEKYILNNVLGCNEIVKCFGTEIAKELTENLEYAEMILDYYAVKHDNNPKKLYIPRELTNENKISILQNYISWERSNPNYLHLISTFKRGDGLPTNDRIRYAAHKKHHEYWSNKENTKNTSWHKYGASIVFYDDSKEHSYPKTENDENVVEFFFGTSWIKDNLDYPTLLNNFIYMFEFVDEQFRYQHLANPSNLGVIERIFGVTGRNDYKTGIDYQIRKISSLAIMTGYLQQLEKFNIKLEDIFKWFFESYLPEEFGANGFSYFAPTDQASWVEKILLLISQFDSVLKQFKFYTEDKFVDRSFLQFSSDPHKLSSTPSMVSKKYVYPKSDRITTAMHLLYSDQSTTYYVDEKSKYKNLPHLLLSREMKVSDFLNYEQPRIEWLIKEGFAFLDEKDHVQINKEVAYLLMDLFYNGVVSYHYYRKKYPTIATKIKDWLETGDLVSKESLFTTQEQEFIDYVLNVQKYDNGPELRNKYAHGIFPLDPKKQEEDYLALLRIMVLIIIKINEEFCIINPE